MNTPLPGFTPVIPTAAGAATQALGDACNNSVFEGDVTIPDGTVLSPGVNFDKIWQIKNTGSCTWDDGYTLVYIGGSTPNLDPYNFDYPALTAVVKPMASGGSGAGGRYNSLSHFMIGRSSIKQKIATTTPVLLSGHGTNISMAFVMPVGMGN